jgi:hypothetical protein
MLPQRRLKVVSKEIKALSLTRLTFWVCYRAASAGWRDVDRPENLIALVHGECL